MALALAAWTTAAAVFYLVPPHAKLIRLVGGQCALLGAFLLYASTTSTAISLVHCSVVSVAASAAASFDGGAAVAAAAAASASGTRASSSAVVSLSVLVSQPSFVCWAAGGSHRPAGVLAAVTLAWYVVGMPALTLWWLVWDPWVRARRSAAAAALAAKGQRVVVLPRAASATSRDAGSTSGVPTGSAALEGGGAKYFKHVARQSNARKAPLARAPRSAAKDPAEMPFDVTNPLRQAASSSAQSRDGGAGLSSDAIRTSDSTAAEAPHVSRGGGRPSDSEIAAFTRSNPLREARAAAASVSAAAAGDSETRTVSEARPASVGPGNDAQCFETANPLKAAAEGRRPISPQLRAALRKSSAASASGRAADPLAEANPLLLALASRGSASDPAAGQPARQRVAVRAAGVSDASAIATQESIDGGGLPPDPILQVRPERRCVALLCSVP